VWWKVFGISTWWWIVLAIAVPLAVVYIQGVRCIPLDPAGSRRQSES
jgi:hypothetical protein